MNFAPISCFLSLRFVVTVSSFRPFPFLFFFRVLFYSFVWVFFIHSQIVLLRWFYGFIKYLFICFRFGYVLMLFPCHHCRCKLFPPTFFTPLNGFGLINDLTFLFTGLTDG
ncbi:hypothetical protein AAZV13_01G024000 [Glycine max]